MIYQVGPASFWYDGYANGRDLCAKHAEDFHDTIQSPKPCGPASRSHPYTARLTRRVGTDGKIALGGARYATGRWLAGEIGAVAVSGGIIELPTAVSSSPHTP
jgi:hypothetical protein